MAPGGVLSQVLSEGQLKRLNARHANASRFACTFVVPAMTHCSGGPATNDFDGLATIVRWVEAGLAPDRIEARGTAAMPGTTRSTGGGGKSAASFACRP